MKKVVFMLAVALAAFCSQAAYVSWSLSGTVAAPLKDSSGSVFTGVAYLVMASDKAAVESALSAEGATGALDASLYVAKGDTFNAKTGGLAKKAYDSDKLTAGTPAEFYTVLVGADGNYTWSTSATATPSSAATTAPAVAMGAGTNFASATWAKVGGDVPEPTSGLLLLIGGAMLALRRKQK